MSRKRKHDAADWHASAPLSGDTFHAARSGPCARLRERLSARFQRAENPLTVVAHPADPEEPLPENMLGSRTVRFFQEYGCESPFWGLNAYGPFEENELELSPDLDRRSRELMEFWEEHFHHDTEWDTTANRRAWQRAGDDLLHAVREELTGTDIIILDERW